ncbi:MAG: TRAP transporter TatT component family protein [Treponema sp.]|nr:TRAP transporter TatT component family protein [Treponema sp.]
MAGTVPLAAGVSVLLALMFSACSLNRLVINKVSDALTGGGSNDVFTGDSDPQLVGDAIPFAIKLYETLLSKNPDHPGLLLTTGSLFIMYANAFVQGPADALPVERYEERDAGRQRAKALYIRGIGILNSALDKKYPGFTAATLQEGTMGAYLTKCTKNDVELLYWAAAGGLGAYSIDVFDFELGNRLPELVAMVKRAYELDPDYGGGALDEFLVLLYGSLPEILGGSGELAALHYQRALEKTGGNSAGVHVSYAQTICVPAQDYDSFKEKLELALAVDVNANPSTRLVNIISQRKARFLLDTAYNYFSFLPMPGDLGYSEEEDEDL